MEQEGHSYKEEKDFMWVCDQEGVDGTVWRKKQWVSSRYHFVGDIDFARAILTSEEYLHFVSETDFGQAWTVEKWGVCRKKYTTYT